jgi:hypothetical protein
VWLFSMVSVGLGITLMTIPPEASVPAGNRLSEVLPYASITVLPATVGALIASRRPRNRVGWALAATGVWTSLQYFSAGYAVAGIFGPSPLAGADVAAWLFAWTGAGIPPFIALTVFLFPDGRLSLRRARVGTAVIVLGSVLLAIGIAISPGPLFNMPAVMNRFGRPGWEGAAFTLAGAGLLLWLASMALMASAVYERYRHAGHVERLQLKWFVVGVAVALSSVLGGPVLAVEHWGWAKLAFATGTSVIPVAIGIAVLRHRLYDIDVVINRALVYAPTTAAIAVAFFAGIVVLQSLLRPLTGGSEVAVAISTLASVALFQPLRGRVQHAVDRRFYRSRYDAARTLDDFSIRLRDQVALASVRADLLAAVRDTVQPTHASVWLRQARP